MHDSKLNAKVWKVGAWKEYFSKFRCLPWWEIRKGEIRYLRKLADLGAITEWRCPSSKFSLGYLRVCEADDFKLPRRKLRNKLVIERC